MLVVAVRLGNAAFGHVRGLGLSLPNDSMETGLARELDAFRNKVAKSAERIIFEVFPTKIVQLQNLIDETSNTSSPFHLSHASATTDTTVYPAPTEDVPLLADLQPKKRKLTADGDAESGDITPVYSLNDIKQARYPNLFLANLHMSKVHEVVKQECEELADLCDKVKLWVTLTMPKIEDGDNFGVQVQEEVLSELHRAHESAYNIRDAARQDYLARAKICSKIIKYPNLQDYTLALREHDDRQLYLARRNLFDMRNVYAVTTDVLHKNIAKIRSPKANNGVNLY